MPGGELIDAAQVERFRADLDRLFPGDAPVLFAVSGGPDSMAMLALAHAAMPARTLAATVDHGLRTESAAEARLVAGWCAAHGIAHATLVVEVPQGATGNLQSWARQERYLLLKRHAIDQGAAALATGHHADDQAETFLMRAARGSGLSGLAGIRERLDEQTAAASPMTVVRPVLGWRHAELRALCLTLALPFIDDPSNTDDRFDRTRFRAWLAQAPWLDPVALGHSAAHLAETDRNLREVSRWLYAQRQARDDPYEEVVDITALPRGVRRLIARIAIDGVRTSNDIGAPPWSWAVSIEPLLDALEAGRAATQAGVLAEPTGDTWRFREAPPRQPGKTVPNAPK